MQELDQYNQMISSMDEMTKLLLRLLTAIAGKDEKGNIQDEDVVELFNHVKDGGKLISSFIPSQDRVTFANMLRDKHVPYHIVDITDPASGEERCLFIMKDKDSKEVNLALDMYAERLQGRCRELTQDVFMDTYRNNGFYRAEGLTLAEMEVFRIKAIKRNMDYCFVPSAKEGCYDVYASNYDELNQCINTVVYNTSGPAGKEYVGQIKDYKDKINDRYKDIVEKSKSDTPTYIVDAADPSNVISISNGKYRKHRLKVYTEKLPNGTMEKSVEDISNGRAYDVNRGMIAELDQFREPVLLTAAEADFIQNIDKGKLIVDDEFADIAYRRALRERMRKENELLPIKYPDKPGKEKYSPKNVITLSELPQSAIRAIRAINEPDIIISGRDVVYPRSIHDKVQEALNRTIYLDERGKPLPKLNVIENNLHYMGRGQDKISDIKDDEKRFLVDIYNPKSYVVFNVDGCEIVKSNGDKHAFRKTDEHYNDVVDSLQNELPSLVLLNEDEFKVATERDNLLDYIKFPVNNKAVQTQMRQDRQEKEEFAEYVTMSNDELEGKPLTVTQKEALERRREISIEITEPDHKRPFEINVKKDREEERTVPCE